MKKLFLFSILALIAGAIGTSQILATQPSINQQGFTGSLPEVLRYVATTFRIPLVAECYEHPKVRLSIPAGSLNGNQVLAYVAHSNHLRLEYRGDLAHLFDRNLVDNKHNQLNHEFANFHVPSDADEFLMILQARLHSDAGKKPSDPSIGGFAISAIPNPELKGKLQQSDLKDITARELLIREGASLSFWVVVWYPYPLVKRPDKVNPNPVPVEGNWLWGDIPKKP